MTTTHLTNGISLDIPAADMAEIQAAIATLQAKLVPHLVDLAPEDRKLLPKMGAKTVEFVGKALSYARANPQLTPAFVDVAEFGRDLAAVETLRGLQQPLDVISDLVADSLLLSGSEAYAAALAFYQSSKSAAKLRMSGAAVIADDLAERFPGRPARAAVAGKAAGVAG